MNTKGPAMLSDAVRRRLAQLNRTPVDETPSSAEGAGYRRPMPRMIRVEASQSWFDRGQVVHNAAGTHLKIAVALADVWGDGPLRLRQRLPYRNRQSPGEPVHWELRALAECFPEQAVLFDLETCGFAGCPIFLVGLLRCVGRDVVIELLLARDYSEEASILVEFWKVLGPARMMVSFNGKCFDWPMLCDRSRLHRLPDPPPAPMHCDLLHHARRRWKHHLPDCKLQTLERYVCHRYRTGDVPGSRIPPAYHEFVRSNDPRELDGILGHNVLDLVTLADLAMRSLPGATRPRVPSSEIA